MAGGVFITGADTGVGKTIVTAGLTYCLRQAGIDAVPMKPVQTGASLAGESLISPDLQFCLQTCSLSPPADEKRLMSPYCFETACSPHLAAQMSGKRIEIAGIVQSFSTLRKAHEAVIVEGAGGVFAPISKSETMLDMMKALSLPAIVVARSGLGTINHTLLTLDALRQGQVELLGVVFNDGLDDYPKFVIEDNIETVARMGAVLSLGHIGKISETMLTKRFPSMLTGLQTVIDTLRSS